VFFALSDGLFKAVESTLPTTEYVYERLNTYNLSHIFLMRQLADLSGTPIAAPDHKDRTK
jgi:N-ethylmaleimide reductase